MKKHFIPTALILLITIISLIIVPFSYFSISKATNQSELKGMNGANVVEAYAVLRPDPNGNWYVLNDKGHSSHNIKYLDQGQSRLVVFFQEPINHIYWSATTPDETLTIDGVSVGASIDPDKAKIYLVQKGKVANPNKYDSSSSNIWFYVKGSR